MLLLSTAALAKSITAKSYMVMEPTGKIVTEKNADDVRPIASITKLMTVMIVLDAHQELDRELTIPWHMSKTYSTKLPRSVKKLSRRTLIELAIVKSDNLAAYTLCSNYLYGLDHCLQAMNSKADDLNLANTQFTDPTGLESTNVSTARELAQLVMHASKYPQILASSKMSKVNIKVKRRWWQFGTTNPLVKKSDNIVVSKTGYIRLSGGCIVMLLNTDFGRRVVVVLGSKNTRTRIAEADLLANYTN